MLRDLSEGMQGPDVTAIQEALEAHQVKSPEGPLRPRGHFGPKTKAAVIAFQKSKHLTPDGIVGANTRAALFPVGMGRLVLTLKESFGPATGRASGFIVPRLHPMGPLTLDKFPGLNLDVPVPHVPAPTSNTGNPARAGSAATPSAQQNRVVIKAGDQLSFPLKQVPTPSKPSPITDAVTLDLLIPIFTTQHLNLGALSGPGTMGVDVGGALTFSPHKYTASATWSVSLAPDLFKYDKWQFLTFSAKAGAGFSAQDTAPKIYPTGNASISLGMSYKFLDGHKGEPSLSAGLGTGISFTMDHRDKILHLSTSLPAALVIQGSF